MSDRNPDAACILDTVCAFLGSEVQPQLQGKLAFDARVALNALQIVARELRLGATAAAAARERLEALLQARGTLEELEGMLIERIRRGELDETHAGLMAHLRASTLDALAIDNPGYSTYRDCVAGTTPGPG